MTWNWIEVVESAESISAAEAAAAQQSGRGLGGAGREQKQKHRLTIVATPVVLIHSACADIRGRHNWVDKPCSIGGGRGR